MSWAARQALQLLAQHPTHQRPATQPWCHNLSGSSCIQLLWMLTPLSCSGCTLLTLSTGVSLAWQQPTSRQPQKVAPEAGSCWQQEQPPWGAGWALHPSRLPRPGGCCPARWQGSGSPARGRPSHLLGHAELRRSMWCLAAIASVMACRMHSACQPLQLQRLHSREEPSEAHWGRAGPPDWRAGKLR